MKIRTLFTVAAFGAAVLALSACSSAPQSTTPGLPQTSARVNPTRVALPAVDKPIPRDSIFVGWRSYKGDGIEVYADAGGGWAQLGKITEHVEIPHALGITKDDYLYACETRSNEVTIYRLKTGGTYTSKLTQGLKFPLAMAFDDYSNLAVINPPVDIAVFPFDHDNQSYEVRNGIAHAYAVAFDRLGNLYVANRTSGGGSVLEYAPYSDLVESKITDGIDSPNALAIDAVGRLYVANAGGHDVTVYGGKSHFLFRTIPTGRNVPQALAVNGDHVYVAAYDRDSEVIDFNVISAKRTLITDGVDHPTRLAVCSKTYLCVLNRRNVTIYQADKLVHTIPFSLPDGAQLLSIASGR